ncbi:MAG: hypothetical protein ABR534_02220 [Desulfotignum sp.]
MPGQARAVLPGSPLWQMPLSGNMGHSRQKSGNKRTIARNISLQNPADAFTVGDYFLAARGFVTRNQGQMLSEAVAFLAENCGRILTIDICLEKHGAFYHPLKITVKTRSSSPLFLVLNGAVKEPGLSLIKSEHRLLGQMSAKVVPSFIPRIFGTANIACARRKVGFFLGEWFAGYHEFHVTRTGNGNQVAVWKNDGEHVLITWDQAAGIYEKIAYVLTAYYDIHTGHEIYPWHHAAGDFVVNFAKDAPLDVRLITVRGYGPLSEMAQDSSASGVKLLACLLFYVLNLTLRMRLDRLDGTGSLVFLPQIVLDAAIKGVFKALEYRAQGGLGTPADTLPAPGDLQPAFVHFISGFSAEQLTDIMTNIMDAWHPDADEQDLVKEHLFSHSCRICKTFEAI